MGSAPFPARILPGTNATTIALSGELDMATVPILQETLVRTEADGVASIVVDLVELTFVEPEVRRVFELTGTGSPLESLNIAVLYP